ncbi:hypothetical protein L209DRAFT_758203 [Thermothelomyces heterothallicus CBS 203.75]
MHLLCLSVCTLGAVVGSPMRRPSLANFNPIRDGPISTVPKVIGFHRRRPDHQSGPKPRPASSSYTTCLLCRFATSHRVHQAALANKETAVSYIYTQSFNIASTHTAGSPLTPTSPPRVTFSPVSGTRHPDQAV